ncbi:hypothetical protein Mal4_27560 [Maioricimonas rarisocia]|uniref:DUF6798 domain-containing protein n=1 Tax=Maioricimonas rarisocia TaxID=2528026 RepID=A0A517Z7K2_9PLAN|nr:DUF6798 domain-containing protein [Maioricimonas rarisocia]QDU38429.1 hypothetical protein Mal4_27560 [Maioricimonas rarisocia]
MPDTMASSRSIWLPLLVLSAMLLAYAAVEAPIPGVNEPHYLTKARHFQDSGWCAGDLFLESGNAHWLFYVVMGPLTQWFDLPVVAAIGRVAALLLVAVGWQMLTTVLVPWRWAGAASASLFLLLQTLGNWSGEWLVGGVESKVFSYGLVLIGWAFLLRRRPIPAAAGLGLATSFHPVVGMWCTLCGLFAVVVNRMLPAAPTDQGEPDQQSEPDPSGWTHLLLAAVLFLLTASPGLITAANAALIAPPEVAWKADYIQVSYRLSHHLDPLTFDVRDYRYYGLLIVLWGLLRSRGQRTARLRLWELIVIGSVLAALAGIALAWGPRPWKEVPWFELRMKLLKFYPFRVADLCIPVGVSIACVNALVSPAGKAVDRRRLQRALLAGLTVAAYGVALLGARTNRPPSGLPPAEEAAWIETLEWVQEHTSEDTLVWAADEKWAVKWYAERPEYVNYKDCPQDPASIVEWNSRLKELAQWRIAALRDGLCTTDELADLRSSTGVSCLIVRRFGPVEPAPDYRSGPFRVYLIPDVPTAAE